MFISSTSCISNTGNDVKNVAEVATAAAGAAITRTMTSGTTTVRDRNSTRVRGPTRGVTTAMTTMIRAVVRTRTKGAGAMRLLRVSRLRAVSTRGTMAHTRAKDRTRGAAATPRLPVPRPLRATKVPTKATTTIPHTKIKAADTPRPPGLHLQRVVRLCPAPWVASIAAISHRTRILIGWSLRVSLTGGRREGDRGMSMAGRTWNVRMRREGMMLGEW